jgi:predicted Zn-dependent protease
MMAALRKWFLLLLPLLLVTACEESPTGRKQLTLLPDSQLAAMGAQAFTDLKQTQPIATDPSVNAFVRCVAEAVIAALPDQQQSWEVVVFSDPVPNAFALPGGKIGVNTGMLTVADTPAQLAAVIGHEIGHVLADHGNERLTQELAVQGGMMLVDLLSSDQTGWKHEALIKALGLGAQYGILLPYSRTHEAEADTIGLELMARAGFDPRQSVLLWQNMAKAGGAQPVEFLSTHPSHESRIENLQEQMDQALSLYHVSLNESRQPDCG